MLFPFRFTLTGGFQWLAHVKKLSVCGFVSLLAPGPVTRPGQRVVDIGCYYTRYKVKKQPAKKMFTNVYQVLFTKYC
jgi:hypothetical protein